MDIDEHLMLKAFDKCFSLLERIDARLNSLEKREFGVDGERLCHVMCFQLIAGYIT